MGIFSVPGSISGPVQGKWWNDIEGQWVETNLDYEAEVLEMKPIDDSDILGDASDENPSEVLRDSLKNIKDPYYYEVLGVEAKSDQSKIKRQYYLLARQYHPDRVLISNDKSESNARFQEIAEAYQVLSDPELRKVYDKEGRDGLSSDKTEIALKEKKIDASLLFAFLFGSDKFYDYVGRLATGTGALVGDENKLSPKDARELQKRRCTRIALNLKKKLEPWLDDDVYEYEMVIQEWKREVNELCTYSYGYEIVQLIGQAYALSAAQFLGSLDSGIGMPSITKWAKGKAALLQQDTKSKQSQMDTLRAGMDMMKLIAKAQEDIDCAASDDERKSIIEKFTKDQLALTLQVLWTVTAIDITSTIHEACQMVFFDKSVKKKEVHKALGKGVARLGEVFLACPEPEGRDKDPFQLYEQATFAATLETIKRKEDAKFQASFRGLD